MIIFLNINSNCRWYFTPHIIDTTPGCQIGDNVIKMLNITSNFLIYKYQTDDVQYFMVDIQNL